MAFRDVLRKYRETSVKPVKKSTKSRISEKEDIKTNVTYAAESKPTATQSSGSFSDVLKRYRESKANKSSVESWIQKSQELLQSAQSTTSNWFDAHKYNSLHNQYVSLLSMTDTWRNQYAENPDAVKTINSVAEALENAKKATSESYHYYAQWDTAEAFNTDYANYQAAQKEKQKLLDFDLEAGSEEIADLEALLSEYDTISNKLKVIATNDPQYGTLTGRMAEISAQFGNQGRSGIEAAISNKRTIYNRAKLAQEGIKLSGVANPSSENYDPNFLNYSEYIGKGVDDSLSASMTTLVNGMNDDWIYEYINNQNGSREKINQKIAIGQAWGSISDDEIERIRYLEKMSEDEVAIYNYYYAKDGKDAAERYLDTIRESLIYREAEKYDNIMDNIALELLFGTVAGVDQYQTGIKKLLNTKDEYIFPSVTQAASGMIREDLEDAGPKLPDWLGGASLGQAAYDAITTTTNMAPSIITSMAIGTINPVAGQIAGTAMMGASAAGNAYAEALNLGYDKGQARAYSALIGASEAGLQYLLGGIGKLGGSLSGQVMQQILSSVDNAIFRTAGKLAGTILSEGMEEGLQEVLTPWFKNLTLHANEQINWNEVAYSSLLGGLTALFMDGGSTVSGEVSTYSTGKKLKNAGISADQLSKLGRTFSADTVAYQLAGKVDENTGAYTIGRLFNEIGASMTEQNVAQITDTLVEMGMPTTIAQKNAEALAYVVEGGKLTDAQIAAIEANDALSKAVITTLIDPNTTWNQRAKGLSEIKSALSGNATPSNGVQAAQSRPAQEITPDHEANTIQNNTGIQSGAEPDMISLPRVTSIADIGKKTLKMEDGTEVAIKDAEIDPDDAVRIETIAGIDGISTEDANFILHTLRSSPNASAQIDALAAKEAYLYGYYGFSKEQMGARGSFVNSLTPAQQNAIYNLARSARQQQANAAQAAVTGNSRNETATGKVHFEGDRTSLTDRQRTSLTGGKTLLELLDGKDVDWDEETFSEDDALIYNAISEMTVSAEEATSLLQGFDGSITAEAYATGITEAYNYGKMGVAYKNINFRGYAAALPESIRKNAYDIGKHSLATTKSEGYNNNIGKMEGTDNVTGEGIHLRGGVQRSDGESAGGSVRGMVERTGAVQNRQEETASRSGNRSKDHGEAQGQVSTKELGIPSGTEDKNLRYVTEDAPLLAEAQKLAADHGLELIAFEGGNLTIKGKTGIFEARAYIDGNKVCVRADHPDFSLMQLLKHEIEHHKIYKDSIDMKKVYDAIVNVATEDYVQYVIESYVAAYASLQGYDADYILEEILCDYEAGMNIFSEKDVPESFWELADEILKSNAVKLDSVRGPPVDGTAKFSRAERGRSIELETMENNRFERLREFYGNIPAEWYAYTRGYFYIYSNQSYTNYTILAKVSITNKNRDAINDFTEALENGTYEYSKTFDSWTSHFRRGKGRYSWDSIRNGNRGPAVRSNGMDGRKQRGKNVRNPKESGRTGAQKSTNSGTNTTRDSSKVKFSWEATDKSYLAAVESGDMETAQRMVEDAAREHGYTIRAYHGTSRGDRVGNVFLPERATSGPMAFFTSDKTVAEGYAKSKKDTSIAYDPDFGRYETQFRIKTKYNDIPLYRAWVYLPSDAKNRITKKAGQLRENWDGDNELILDPDTNEANGGFQWQLTEARGNAIQALTEQWLNSGNLYNEEARFLEVLEMAGVTEEFKKIGMDSLYFKDPDAKHEKVYDTFLKITNPFDTATVDKQFVEYFESWYEEQDQDQYVRENMESDMWDKNGIDAYDFAERLRDDIKNGTAHAWTSIPDSVTDYLKFLGYDGIKDTGGKFWADPHIVWIPFTSEQIKSAEPVVYADGGNIIPLSERFDATNRDIRFSREFISAQMTEQEKYLQKVNRQLEKDNAKLQEDKQYLKQLLKIQKEVTGGTKYTRSSVEAMARLLKAKADAKGDTKELASLLNSFYEFIASSEDISWEAVMEQAEVVADWLLNNKQEHFVRDEYAQRVLDDLKGRSFHLDESQKGEAVYAYGSYQAFRLKVLGNVMPNDNAKMSLDQFWKEMSAEHPHYFPAEISSGDQVQGLVDVIHTLRTMEKEPDAEFYGQAGTERQSLLQDIYDSFWRVSTLRTVADSKQKEINNLKAKHYARMNRIKEEHQKTIEQINEEYRLRMDKLKEAYRIRTDEKVQQVKEKYQTAKKKAIETRDKRDAREKLQKLVIDTAKWISYPSKTDVKCPDLLKKPYAEFLNSIDLSSQRLADGGDPTQNDLRLANSMNSLATALERIVSSQDPTQDHSPVLDSGYLDLPANFVQILRDTAEDIQAQMGTTEYVVNKMPAEEIRKLSQMIRTLNHAIREVGKLYANMRFSNIQELGKETVSTLDSLGVAERTGGIKDYIQWDNALPFYAFKRFGKGGESIFEGMMDAQDKLAFLAKDIFAFREKSWTDKEAKSWSEDTHTIELTGEKKLTVTTADAMSIYCLSRRKQGLQHLLAGGVRVIGHQKGEQKARDSRSLLTIADINAVISSLTDRQKQVAEAMQEFMSTVCAEWGNEISMKRFLTREFNEKYYFPIESNNENLTTKDPAAQQSDLFRLLNISATKPLDPNANNEVIIRNAFDVFTNHAADMARLNAFGMALLDYMKWLNYRVKSTNDQGQIIVSGVRKSMAEAYGNGAFNYILNLVKDINGRPSDGGVPGFYAKMLRSAKTAMVGNSLRVATLQITSYPRAALVLSPKNLVLGLSKMPNIKRAKKYCGIALWKSYGFYDTNISRSIEEQIKGTQNIQQRLIELSLKGAELGDAITWGCLWNACEYEVAGTKQYKTGSEEFYQAVGKKLREVVYKTQVVDSTLTRSAMMRSKNAKAQELSAFMSEPTLSANILMDAGFTYEMAKRRSNARTAWKQTGKNVMRAVGVYSIGQLSAALMEGFWDAWRNSDDDEFEEKFLKEFKENLILDILPFNKIPILSDMAEALLSMVDIGFFSSESLSSTALSQTMSAVKAWADVLEGKTSETPYNALYKTIRAVSSFLGVSINGVMRECVALWNNTAGAYDITWKIRTWDLSDKKLAVEALDAILEGNTRQAESIAAEFTDETSYHSALRSAINNHLSTGKIDSDTAVAYLIKYCSMDKDDAYWKVEEWVYEAENGDDFEKYGEFFTAVQTGKNLRAVVNEYTANGVTPETLISNLKSHFKPLYINMSRSEKAGIKGYLLNAMTLCGKERADAEEIMRQWEFEADYPDLVDAISFDQYQRWQTEGKRYGVTVYVFADVSAYRNDAEDGVRNQEDVANYINSLKLTTAQKDALWRCFWSASTVKNAPWH